jgi:phosphoserine phosphatase RsbU/P
VTVFSFILLAGLVVLGYLLWKQTEKTSSLEAQQKALVEHGEHVLTFLHDVGEAFNESLKQEEIFKLIIQCAVRTSKAKSGAMFLLDTQQQFLEAVVIEGPFPPPTPPADHIESKLASRAAFLEQTILTQKIKNGEGILGTVAKTGKPVLIKKPGPNSGLPHYDNEILKIDTYLAVPLIFRDQIYQTGHTL